METNRITWKTISLFVIVFCVLLSVLCIPYYSAKNNGYMYNDVRYKTNCVNNEKDESLDVIFLGDSEAWSAFSPLQIFYEYGIPSYNCATPGQWTGDSAKILKKVLKHQKPSVVVLGTSTIYSNLNPIKYALSKYVPIFHYHNYYKNTSAKYSDRKNKGANLNEKIVPYTGITEYMSSHTKTKKIERNSLKGLNTLLKICNENNIRLVLVTTPSALTWNTGKHQAVEDWASSNDVDYYDYNDTDAMKRIAFDWSTDTRDKGDHLNLNGSKKISKDFGNILKDNYTLENRLKDTTYLSWLEAYDSSSLYKKGDSK